MLKISLTGDACSHVLDHLGDGLIEINHIVEAAISRLHQQRCCDATGQHQALVVPNCIRVDALRSDVGRVHATDTTNQGNIEFVGLKVINGILDTAGHMNNADIIH